METNNAADSLAKTRTAKSLPNLMSRSRRLSAKDYKLVSNARWSLDAKERAWAIETQLAWLNSDARDQYCEILEAANTSSRIAFVMTLITALVVFVCLSWYPSVRLEVIVGICAFSAGLWVGLCRFSASHRFLIFCWMKLNAFFLARELRLEQKLIEATVTDLRSQT